MHFPLATTRLVLHMPGLQDVHRLQALLSPWNMSKWLTIPYPYTHEHARYWIETGCKTSGVHPNIYRENILIGGVGLTHHSDGSHELGYWISDAEQGKGYAFEAVSAFLQAAMLHMPIVSLHAKCLIENHASSKLLKKLGFSEFGAQDVHRMPWNDAKTCRLFRYALDASA